MARPLRVTIGQATFAKDCNYFIALQFDAGGTAQKFRTEVSEPLSKPFFTKNSFTFDLPDDLTATTISNLERVQFGLFVMLPENRTEDGETVETTTKLLGSTSYDLREAMDQLLDDKDVTSTLTFIRRPQPEVEVPVGRVVITVSMRTPDSTDGSNPSQPGQGVKHSTMLKPALLHGKHGHLVFVQLHQAVNLPLASPTSPPPSTAVEVMCVDRDQRTPTGRKVESAAVSVSFPNSCNPAWNQLLVVETHDVTDNLQICVINKDTQQVIADCFLPLEDMDAQHCYNLQLMFPDRASLFCSVMLAGSTDAEQAMFGRSDAQRLEVLLNGFDQQMPMAGQGQYIVAEAALLPLKSSNRNEESIQKQVAVINAGSFPNLHFIKIGGGEELRQQLEYVGATRSLRKLSPWVQVHDPALPYWGFPMLFDVGAPGSLMRRIVDYSGGHSGNAPACALLVKYFAVAMGGGAQTCAEAEFVGHSVVHFPARLTSDGTPAVAMAEIALADLSAAPAMDNAAGAKPRLSVRLRLWSGDRLVGRAYGQGGGGGGSGGVADFYLGEIPPALPWLQHTQSFAQHPVQHSVGLAGLLGAKVTQLAHAAAQDGVASAALPSSSTSAVHAHAHAHAHAQYGGGGPARAHGEDETLVNRLMKEVDKRSAAIRSCGVEIVELRRQKGTLVSENQRLRESLNQLSEQQARAVAHTLAHTHAGASREQLLQQLAFASQKLQAMQGEKEHLLQRLSAAGRAAASEQELRVEYEALQKAHTVQAAFLQKLQGEAGKLAVYKATVKTQEKVIAKLERLLESKVIRQQAVAPQSQQPRGQGIINTNASANADAEVNQKGDSQRVKELEAEVTALTDKLKSSDGSSLVGALREKITILEEQMITNVKQVAKENFELKQRIFELQEEDDDDDDDD